MGQYLATQQAVHPIQPTQGLRLGDADESDGTGRLRGFLQIGQPYPILSDRAVDLLPEDLGHSLAGALVGGVRERNDAQSGDAPNGDPGGPLGRWWLLTEPPATAGGERQGAA